MAKYYADCEFESSTGRLLSLGIVCPSVNKGTKGKALYMIDTVNVSEVKEPWVKEHVVPSMFFSCTRVLTPDDWDVYTMHPKAPCSIERNKILYTTLEMFLKNDNDITIVVDWPEDVKYISDLILTGPGTMINIPSVKFEVRRVDSYPNDINGCIQHHALWDAIALAVKLQGLEDSNKSNRLDSLLLTILKFSKSDNLDTSYDCLKAELAKTYHDDMTFGDVISLLCNAYDDLLKEPRFEQNLRSYKSQIEEIIKAPVDWRNRMVVKKSNLTLQSELSVIEFYQPIISTILSKFRLARVDWCADQLK